jgi:hypothetical protein
MEWRYRKHYTRDEARALLPEIRTWLRELAESRTASQEAERQMLPRLSNGEDLGGPSISRWLATLVKIKGLIDEFERREIQLKDLDRGLVDFPAFLAGREVFLCWEMDEPDIEFWHELTAGYTGRERLD